MRGIDDGTLHRAARRTSKIRINKLTIATADLVAVTVAMLVATFLKVRYVIGDTIPASQYLATGVIILPVWVVALRSRRLYESRFVGRRADELRRIMEAVAITMVATIVYDFAFKMGQARTWVGLLGICSFVALALHRECVRRYFKSRHNQGRGLRRVVMVGDNEEALAIEDMLRSDRSLGYAVVGRVVQRSGARTPDVAGMLLDDVLRAVRDADAQGVVIAVTALDATVANQLVRALAYSGLHLQLSSALSDIAIGRLSMRPMGRLPVVYIEPVNRFGWRPAAKRAFDTVGSVLGLVALAPVLAVCAIAIKATSKGPVLFSQERLGKNGATFRCLKLRTMITDAADLLVDLRGQNEADGPLFKMKNDPRVTRIGRFLRTTSIDELPQLWNVIRGDMSLIGPRPAIPSETEMWSPDLFDRLRVRPGITGMWQVNGRSEASFDEYTRLDLYYVDNWSLLMDVTILLKTIPTVLARRGAA